MSKPDSQVTSVGTKIAHQYAHCMQPATLAQQLASDIDRALRNENKRANCWRPPSQEPESGKTYWLAWRAPRL